MTEQAGLCWTWSETQIVGFLISLILSASASDSNILEDIQSRFNRLTEADTLEHIQARFNELAAQTFSTLAAANAAVSSEIEARARHNADKTGESNFLLSYCKDLWINRTSRSDILHSRRG